MFGRRRRPGLGAPILGTALVVGASRSAARREVQRQGESTAAMQAQMLDQQDREEAKRRRDEEDQDKRTQLAIEAALAKDRASRGEEGLPSYGMAQNGNGRQYNQNENVQYGRSQQDNTNSQYCPACGQLNQRDNKFCPGCGRRQNLEKAPNETIFNEGTPL
jgi:hypothetical protein